MYLYNKGLAYLLYKSANLNNSSLLKSLVASFICDHVVCVYKLHERYHCSPTLNFNGLILSSYYDARELSIDSRAYVISQHVRGQSERHSPPAPIRTPEWSSRLSGKRQILYTQPRGTPEHERHLAISFRRLYFPYYIFPPHLSVFDHRAILIWGDRDMAGGCSLNKPNTLQCFLHVPTYYPGFRWVRRDNLYLALGHRSPIMATYHQEVTSILHGEVSRESCSVSAYVDPLMSCTSLPKSA